LISLLPDAFSTDSNLEILDLGNTALSGLLPASLAFAPNLKFLNLRDNDLDGQIPEFSQKSIEYVDLSDNNLIGAVPHSLAAHPALRFLDAGGNQLTSLPVEWTESVYENSTGTPFPIEEILLSGNDLQVGARFHNYLPILGRVPNAACVSLSLYLPNSLVFLFIKCSLYKTKYVNTTHSFSVYYRVVFRSV